MTDHQHQNHMLNGATPVRDEIGEVIIARSEVPVLMRDPSCTRCTDGRSRMGTLCGCVTEVQP